MSELDDMKKELVGKRIVDILYAEVYGEHWPVILLEGGATIMIQSDDEGNGPGVALHTQSGTGTWRKR